MEIIMKKSLRLLLTLSLAFGIAAKNGVPLFAMEGQAAIADFEPAPTLTTIPAEWVPLIAKYVGPQSTMYDFMKSTLKLRLSSARFNSTLEALMPSREDIQPIIHPADNRYALEMRLHSPILFAAALGNMPLMKFSCSPTTNLTDFINHKNGLTAAHYAAYYNQPEMLQELILSNPELLEFMDGDSNTPLHVAALQGNDECVNVLLCNHARVDVRNGAGQTPLALEKENTEIERELLAAAQANNTDNVRRILLVNRGINVNAQNDNGNTALTWATHNNNLEMFNALMARPEINVNAQNRYGHTALTWAVLRKNLAMFNALIAKPEINVNAHDNYGYTALILAAVNNNLEMVNALMARPEINVNAQSEDGATALTWAARNNNLEIFNALMDRPEIDVNAQNIYGDTALISAAHNNNLEMFNALMARPEINVNAQNILGWTALIYAAKHNNLEMVIALLAIHGIDVNAQNNHDGHTALIYAASHNNLEMLNALVARPEIDVNVQDRDGATALICAAGRHNLEMFNALMARPEINVNAQNILGWTALICSAYSNNLEMFNALMDRPEIIIDAENANVKRILEKRHREYRARNVRRAIDDLPATCSIQ